MPPSRQHRRSADHLGQRVAPGDVFAHAARFPGSRLENEDLEPHRVGDVDAAARVHRDVHVLAVGVEHAGGDHGQQLPAEVVDLGARAGLLGDADPGAVGHGHVGGIAAARKAGRIVPVEAAEVPEQFARPAV